MPRASAAKQQQQQRNSQEERKGQKAKRLTCWSSGRQPTNRPENARRRVQGQAGKGKERNGENKKAERTVLPSRFRSVRFVDTTRHDTTRCETDTGGGSKLTGLPQMVTR
ncbi:hypothetical protein JDV02_002016 [Purpureocillium takamizusanense]|uniref:Uncharacterized protein n=1 Tax=Purpureocillium takamizusanense TaxID=2060973 RepID=A0A9Q8QAW0_9HYPO|nr:uncharacterized protein JDV02_002016 [Purpureocillium takamizusanense]UNI15487.1 hypothetical protein JDV02_002016 [Purpureocillium takamizusanense]